MKREIHGGFQPLLIAKEMKSLVAEGRKCGKAAEKTHKNKKPHLGMEDLFLFYPGAEQADEKASDDVYSEGSPGKTVMSGELMYIMGRDVT